MTEYIESFSSSLGQTSDFKKGVGKTLSSSIGFSRSMTRSGVGSGAIVYYSNKDTPETWTFEDKKVKVVITDTIDRRCRTAELYIANILNSKESIYEPYRRIKIKDGLSNRTIFKGRVVNSDPSYDSTGQILKIICKDYLTELFNRRLSSSYTTQTRSAIITSIVTNYTYAGTVTTNIEPSGSSDTLTKDYLNSEKLAIQIIEELAKEDPWTDETWTANGKVWHYSGAAYTDRTAVVSTGPGPTNFLTAASDYYYFGQNNPFLGVTFDLTTFGSYGEQTWEYYNGSSWSSLTINKTYDFSADGSIKWNLPTNWTTNSVNGTTKYWVRASVTSVSTTATIVTAKAVRGYGYDYYVDDDQVFQYFRRGSKPSGGPSSSGLTIALQGTSSDTTKLMLHDYQFTEEPTEIVTRVLVKGYDNTGTLVTSASPHGINSSLESELQIQKEKVEFVWGSNMTNSNLQTYCNTRADALMQNIANENLVRGKFKIPFYPSYARSPATIVRAGDMIRVNTGSNSSLGLDTDFLILESVYEEPPGITKLNVIENIYGKGVSPFETGSVIESLRQGDDLIISSARITDLIVDSAKIVNLQASKVIVSGATTLADWRHGSDATKIDGGNIYTNSITASKVLSVGSEATTGARIKMTSSYLRAYLASSTLDTNDYAIEINPSTGIYGYSWAAHVGTKQFYLDAADGKAYAGGGAVILDSTGITTKGSAFILKDINDVVRGYINGTLSDMQFYSGTNNYISMYSARIDISTPRIDILLASVKVGQIQGYNYGGNKGVAIYSVGLTSYINITDTHIDVYAPFMYMGGGQVGYIVLPTAASDPSTSFEGAVYYNTTSHVLRGYDGVAWATL